MRFKRAAQREGTLDESRHARPPLTEIAADRIFDDDMGERVVEGGQARSRAHAAIMQSVAPGAKPRHLVFPLSQWRRKWSSSMPIYALDDAHPELPADGDYWIAPNAVIIGKVRLLKG